MRVSRTVQIVTLRDVSNHTQSEIRKVTKGGRVCAVDSLEIAYGWTNPGRVVTLTARGYEAPYGWPNSRPCRLDLTMEDGIPDWLLAVIIDHQPKEWL